MSELNRTTEPTPEEAPTTYTEAVFPHAPNEAATAERLRSFEWPAWFTPLSSFALTVWIVAGVLLFVMTVVGTFYSATGVSKRDAENDLWILAGYTLVATLYGSVLCLHEAMNGHRRLVASSPPRSALVAETARSLWNEARLPVWLHWAIAPVGVMSLVQGVLLLSALVYFLVTMGTVIPEAFYFVLAYLVFLTLLTLASFGGGVCLLTAAKGFRTLRDAAKGTL